MFFSSWLRALKVSLERSTSRNARRPRPHVRRAAPRLNLELLEDRTVLSQAIFYAASGGSPIFVSPTDINAAFADILAASGRSTAVITQVRKGGPADNTTAGSVIDAEFTPTGLFTLDPTGSVRLPVTVQQFATYFGFDHFNWQQTVTLPSGWLATYSLGDVAFGGPLGSTFTDPQPANVTLTGNVGNKVTVDAVGDFSGLYLTGDAWQSLSVNPLPLDSNPNPAGDPDTPPILRLATNPYWFAFEDAPSLPSNMYGIQDVLTFGTTLVGVLPNGSAVRACK
jgi:hypothetical protein